MKQTTNLKLHMIVGFIAGFMGSIFKPADTNPAGKLRFAVIGSLVWLLVTLAWEAWQWRRSGMTLRTYWQRKGTDTVLDLVVGNAAFLMPFLVLTMGTYMGNQMRP